MQQCKAAMELTTSHGLPRMVTNKPLYVRIAWLLFFLLMTGLFFKGFVKFAAKMQSRPVTTSLEANSVRFQFPDIYVCFENPVSASYSSRMDRKSADAINKGLDFAESVLFREAMAQGHPEMYIVVLKLYYNYLYPQSLPYNLLIDALAHRMEQALIDGYSVYTGNNGLPSIHHFEPTEYYDPQFLRCLKWNLSKAVQENILRSSLSSGLFISVLIDTAFSDLTPTNASSIKQLYVMNSLNDARKIPLPNWSLSTSDQFLGDRRSGIRVFLTSPGECPTGFATSYSLGPGKHHTVDISMTQYAYKNGQFDCISDAPDVQFVNSYDQTPYNHTYSYSYCYYYEYHKRIQDLLNVSGFISPLPWELRNKKYALNLTLQPPNFLSFANNATLTKLSQLIDGIVAVCDLKRPCSTLDYSVSISSADWPLESSLEPFLSGSVQPAWRLAKTKNLSVPVLDFLMTANASRVAAYVRSNMLKVLFKPRNVMCDQVSFSKDYDLEMFISDIGGIMGIYLGMSLLTLCELLELAYDLLAHLQTRKKSERTISSADNNHIDTSIPL